MVSLSFGLGKFINFSIDVGSQSCHTSSAAVGRHISPMPLTQSPADPDELGSSATRSEYSFQEEVEPLDESDSSSVIIDESRPKCHFLEIPYDIRITIYRLLLVSSHPIHNAHKLMGPKKSVLVSKCPQITDIDSAILRTCRSVYEESLPVLYRMNRFSFYDLVSIWEFGHHEIPRMRPLMSADKALFNFKPALYGRLTMLRSVNMRLGSGYSSWIGDRERLWESWHEFFDLKRNDGSNGFIPHPAAFPALESLFLDFTDWALDGGKESEMHVSSLLSFSMVSVGAIPAASALHTPYLFRFRLI